MARSQEDSLRAYVQQQLEWGRFWKLLEFSDKVDRLLEVVGPGEVCFQPGCSASEIKALIPSIMKEVGAPSTFSVLEGYDSVLT